MKYYSPNRFSFTKYKNISKHLLTLKLKNRTSIIVSDKFKHTDDGFKYFIGYQEDDIIKPSCISLPQKSVYIKHFEKGGTKMSFIIKDDSVLVKNKEIWNNTKKALSIKFHSNPVYDEK